MKQITKLIAAAALTVITGTAQAATLTNGSFEDIGSTSLNGGGWSFFNSIPGWTGVPEGEVQSDRTIGQVDAQDGEYYIELDTRQNATISQEVALETGKYMLSFFYSPRVNDPSNGTNDMLFEIAGLLSGSVRNAPDGVYPYRTWTEVSRVFEVAQADTYRLSFTGAGAENESNGCGDCGALIDNVSLAPVPLPASLLFLLAGLASLRMLWARRATA